MENSSRDVQMSGTAEEAALAGGQRFTNVEEVNAGADDELPQQVRGAYRRGLQACRKEQNIPAPYIGNPVRRGVERGSRSDPRKQRPSKPLSGNVQCNEKELLANIMNFDEAILRVNIAVVNRLSRLRRGVSNKKEVLTGDLAAARKGSSEEVAVTSRPKLKELGLRIGRWGFVEGGEDASEGALEEASGSGAAGGVLPAAEGSDVDLTCPAGEIEGHARRRSARLSASATYAVDFEEDEVDEEELGRLGGELEDVAGIMADDEDDDSTGAPGDWKCGCSKDVPSSWQTMVVSKRLMKPGVSMKLLGKMVSYKRVCYRHGRMMASYMGLCTKRLGDADLAVRLRTLYEKRLEIGKLKTEEETFQWFRVANRPARPSDGLGPYKFMHNRAPGGFQFDQEEILSAWDATILLRWQAEGSVIHDLFGWWFTSPLGSEIYDEFNMYLHYLREINGRKNIGWLRNMFFSVTQQLMRQDPAYYMLYAALRPDRAWRLVSYLYYAKYSVPGDGTYFCHIDLNIPDLLANKRGVAMIQGTVSLDEEDEENCTFILPGMQHRLGEWWERVKERGQETSGFVHRITDQLFTKEDSELLGVRWKKTPCQPGEVRITLPSIPHGATGPTTKIRRTMLPWFVGVQDDESSLEVVEGGTWEELATAHRDFVAPKATPSGLANRYGAIPYRFPACVELAGLGAVSDALVCRRRWSSPAVVRERDVLLGKDRAAAHEFIRRWREHAIKAALEAFAAVREEEKRVFGEKSYYYYKERLELLGIPMPAVVPDPDVLGDEELEEAGGEGLLFAEEGEEGVGADEMVM
ncbi:uncharacterized protein BP5553_07613 [Venustampulla echinocandica]|uniref:Uncharacterized protein n=1 Tax=Venustampulla echinocandica TaxID=2656787 RepID=A0A370TH04_9HELO|nr:uncharacterized protein BP5553_07613 [Venustampulla echinocandica]RDL34485.1 hypothetical protein BP5553_07613 [Venustampulla echinocandica]